MSAIVVLEARSLADQAFDRLVDAITRGELEPGARLSETLLAKTLGISRGPLREAIRRLEGRKLVVRTPNVGPRIVSPSVDGLKEIFMIRERLEGLAARLATERMSDREIDELEEKLQQHATGKELLQGHGYFQRPGDEDFHFLIAHASKSEKLIELLCDDLYYLLRIYRFRASNSSGRAQNAFKEHQSIVAAMRKRDPDAAEVAMRKHVASARESLSSRLPASEREVS